MLQIYKKSTKHTNKRRKTAHTYKFRQYDHIQQKSGSDRKSKPEAIS